MGSITQKSLYAATMETITALGDAGELDDRDTGMARLALEIADRIDSDGPSAYVSSYGTLMYTLMALRHEQGSPALIAPSYVSFPTGKRYGAREQGGGEEADDTQNEKGGM